MVFNNVSLDEYKTDFEYRVLSPGGLDVATGQIGAAHSRNVAVTAGADGTWLAAFATGAGAPAFGLYTDAGDTVAEVALLDDEPADSIDAAAMPDGTFVVSMFSGFTFTGTVATLSAGGEKLSGRNAFTDADGGDYVSHAIFPSSTYEARVIHSSHSGLEPMRFAYVTKGYLPLVHEDDTAVTLRNYTPDGVDVVLSAD